MVVKFEPGQVNFSAIPSIDTSAQRQTAEVFRSAANAFSTVSRAASERAREEQLAHQEEIKARIDAANNDAVRFSNKQLAANLSGDFNRAAREIISANASDPVKLKTEMLAFAKGQVKGLGQGFNADEYMAVVAPKVEAYMAQAQTKAVTQLGQQAEIDMAEAVSLKQEELLSLDFSFAESRAAAAAGITEFTNLVQARDIPVAEKEQLIIDFQKSLAKKTVLDMYEKSDDKDKFIAEVSKADLDGFDAQERDGIVKDLISMRQTSLKAEEMATAEAEAAEQLMSANLHADLRIMVNNPNATGQQLVEALRTAQNAREQGKLKPEQAANLIIEINNKMNARVTDSNAMANVLAAMNGTQVGFDPDDKNNIKAIDNVATTILQGAQDPEQAATKIAQLVSNTRIIPPTVRSTFKAAGRSNSLELVKKAADMYARIEEMAPEALVDVSPKETAILSEVSSLMRAGLTPKEAFERAKEVADPMNSAVVAQRKTDIKDMEMDFMSEVENTFDQSIFSGVDMSGNKVAEMAGQDFQRAFESYYIHKPDEAWAREMARKAVQRKWAVTSVDSSRRLMAFAPENYYRIPGLDDEWMQRDFQESVKSWNQQNMPDSQIEKSFLVPDFVTARDATNGRKPSYQIHFINPRTGVIEIMRDENNMPVFWQPDGKKALEEFRATTAKKIEEMRSEEDERRTRVRQSLSPLVKAVYE